MPDEEVIHRTRGGAVPKGLVVLYLRMSPGVREAVGEAAAVAGQSLNEWAVAALRAAAEGVKA